MHFGGGLAWVPWAVGASTHLATWEKAQTSDGRLLMTLCCLTVRIASFLTLYFNLIYFYLKSGPLSKSLCLEGSGSGLVRPLTTRLPPRPATAIAPAFAFATPLQTRRPWNCVLFRGRYSPPHPGLPCLDYIGMAPPNPYIIQPLRAHHPPVSPLPCPFPSGPAPSSPGSPILRYRHHVGRRPYLPDSSARQGCGAC